MRKLLLGSAAILAFGLFSGSGAAQNIGAPANPTFQLAGTQIFHTWTPYSFNFTASSTLTNLTFAFRDDPAYLSLDNIVMTTGASSNLVTNGDFEQGPNGQHAPVGWTYVNEYGASAAGIVSSNAGVGGSYGYYDGAVGSYDAITQAISTVVGSVYNVSFMLNEDSEQSTYSATSVGPLSGINLAVYAQEGIPGPASSAVPEPASWMMMIVGFGAVGYAARRNRRRVQVRFN